MATKLSDAEIKALVNQNILKPAALAATAAASGVTLADLSRAAGVSADKLGSYFADAKVDTSALATKITPDEAAELMRRSQVGGVPTSEFNAAGGYAAVKKLAQENTTGYQAGVSTVADRAKYAPDDVATRYDPGGQGGLGETFYASGNSATGKGSVPVPVTTFTPPTTAGQLTTVPSAAVTPGLIKGAATSTAQVAPIQLNLPVASGGAGLLTGANSLAANPLAATPGTFSVPNTETGNVNTGGLISGVQQQLFSQNAQVGLPTGVTPTIGALGNNTGGPSIAPYNPYGFRYDAAKAKTGATQNYYNPKTGQRYTAPAGFAPPSTDWQTYTPGAATAASTFNLSTGAGSDQTVKL
jgi:hypothetical protein